MIKKCEIGIGLELGPTKFVINSNIINKTSKLVGDLDYTKRIKNVAYSNHTFPNKLSYLTKSYISHGIYNPIEMIKRDKLLDKKGGKYHNNNNKMTQ